MAKLFAPGDGLALVTGLTAPIGSPPILGVALGVAEILIAAAFLHERTMPLAALATVLHQLGTFAAFFILHDLTVASFPWLTLDGQFVIKNIMLIGGALLLWHLALQLRSSTRSTDHDVDPHDVNP